MKITIFTLLFILSYSSVQSCSFNVSPFCNTVNEENTSNVILRGYFSEDFSNGLTFIRIETLRGDEERDQIKVWDNTSFDCNGLHERKASQMGVINQEIIISLSKVDSIIFGNEILSEDYRVPEGLWWQTHSLIVDGDSIKGFYFLSQQYDPTYKPIHYDDFIDEIINNTECVSTSTVVPAKGEFTVFPTLVEENISIKADFDIEKSKVFIYGINGCASLTVPSKSNINLGMLAKGMYIVMVETENNKCLHQKIIKI